jgi:hypothetical protein
MKYLRTVWHLWSLSLGEKAHKKDHVADKVAILRSVIFATYLVTNCFIVAGVIRHWNDEPKILIELHDDTNRNQDTHPERRNNLGMGGDIRAQRIY